MAQTLLTKVVAHHMRNKNDPLGGKLILHPAQVIRASFFQALGSDLSLKNDLLAQFLGRHEVRYSNGVGGKDFGVWTPLINGVQ